MDKKDPFREDKLDVILLNALLIPPNNTPKILFLKKNTIVVAIAAKLSVIYVPRFLKSSLIGINFLYQFIYSCNVI